jgi:hypothetical protein
VIGKLLKIGLLGAIAAVVVVSLPDLKRYLEMRQM